MWFDLGRKENFPSNYGSHATAVTVDVLDAGFITAGVILVIAFFISIPTTRLKDVSTRLLLFLYCSAQTKQKQWQFY